MTLQSCPVCNTPCIDSRFPCAICGWDFPVLIGDCAGILEQRLDIARWKWEVPDLALRSNETEDEYELRLAPPFVWGSAHYSRDEECFSLPPRDWALGLLNEKRPSSALYLLDKVEDEIRVLEKGSAPWIISILLEFKGFNLRQYLFAATCDDVTVLLRSHNSDLDGWIPNN